jgi:hypothetical protein
VRHVTTSARVLVMAALVCAATGCASARPKWTVAPPAGYSNDYFTGSGTGVDRPAARNAAISSAVARFAESGRLNVQVVRTDSSISSERFKSGNAPTLDRIDKTVQEIITTGESPTIRGLKLKEEYAEQANLRQEVWVLMAVPKTAGLRTPPTRSSLVLRSLLLPGWGQYAMGSERKGLWLALGALASVPTAASFASLKNENLSRARATDVQASRTYYENQANRYGTLATATLAGAAAIWGYGIIDAASSPVKLYVDARHAQAGLGLQLALGK